MHILFPGDPPLLQCSPGLSLRARKAGPPQSRDRVPAHMWPWRCVQNWRSEAPEKPKHKLFRAVSGFANCPMNVSYHNYSVWQNCTCFSSLSFCFTLAEKLSWYSLVECVVLHLWPPDLIIELITWNCNYLQLTRKPMSSMDWTAQGWELCIIYLWFPRICMTQSSCPMNIFWLKKWMQSPVHLWYSMQGSRTQ